MPTWPTKNLLSCIHGVFLRLCQYFEFMNCWHRVQMAIGMGQNFRFALKSYLIYRQLVLFDLGGCSKELPAWLAKVGVD